MEGEDRKVDQAADGPKRGKLWLILLAIIIIGAGAGGYFIIAGKTNGGSSVDGGSNDLSKMIQADFIDLSKVYSISKFRSGSGHDFSKGSGESCRSMKHYFNPQETTERWRALEANQGMPPAPDGKNDIAIYSPVDGKITLVTKEQTPIGEQIYIEPDGQSDVSVRLFHIYLDDGFKKGSTVKAGQKIGDISQYSSSDVAITKRKLNKVTYYSYFEAMSDNLFAKYQERGVKSRDDLILTKEYRDANSLQCSGEQFAQNYDQDPSFGNYVYLSGATVPTAGTSTNSTPSTPGTPSAEEQSATSSSSSGSSTTNTGAGAGGGNGTGGGEGGASGER